jgi:hypothetical protein
VARSRIRKPVSSAAQAAADSTAERAARAWHRMTHRYGCSCAAKDCKGAYRTRREWQRHNTGQSYWRSKAGKAMGRKLRDQDTGRRNARAGRHVNGDLDHRGRPTPKGRARPDVRGGPRGARQRLQDAERFDRNHRWAEDRERKAENAEARGKHEKAQRLRDQAARRRDGGPAADRLKRMADRAAAKGKEDRAKELRKREENLRGGHYNLPPRTSPMHPSRLPQRPEKPVRQPKARTAPADGRAPRSSNGTRPAPARTPTAGRLAPAPNGTRPAPQRQGRTRT